MKSQIQAELGLPVVAAQEVAGHNNMLQLIYLRWIAVFGQIVTIIVVSLGLGIHLPLLPMLYVLACLIAFNIASHLRWHEEIHVSNRELFLALLVDVGILTAQLYLSGGTNNPFAFLYLLQIILSAVLLETWSTWVIVAITSACLIGLSSYSHPLLLPAWQSEGFANLYRTGMVLCFLLNAALLVYFLTRISQNLKLRDAELADLQKHASDEEHIVQMGLLASGAAHELGTPMATMSVILGDWKRMPEFTRNPELLEDLNELQMQLKRCKSIVSGVLLSAGEARGESSTRTTINTFLNNLVAEFRATRTIIEFEFSNFIEEDLPVVLDTTFKQMLCNVLDNALEASPLWLRLEAMAGENALRLRVCDRGSGFDPAILHKLGQPYQSTKGRPGSGLGLFFVVNVARKLGGQVSVRQGVEGGAIVDIELSLSSLIL